MNLLSEGWARLILCYMKTRKGHYCWFKNIVRGFLSALVLKIDVYLHSISYKKRKKKMLKIAFRGNPSITSGG